MKKILTLTTLFAALLTLVGCEKTEDDTPDGMIEIFAESMNGGSKVILDGLDATWRSGDEIRINGSTATVERCGDRAYISNASISEGTNRALYPASLSTVNWGTDNPTITFPAYYHYRTDGAGHQVLDLPMAAYSTGSTPLQFKHLTGALYITVKNTSANPRTIQSVTVKSNTYALNGNMNVAMNTTSLISARGDANEKYRCVTLVFDEVVNLSTNASVQVMIPILPVGSDNKFTIEVKSYEEGQSTSYLSSKSQTSEADHSLARNQLGYAPMDIPVGETNVSVLPFNDNSRWYEIYTPFDFVKMTEAINNTSSYNGEEFHLMNDIDMTGFAVTTINNISFGGTIKGYNHSISNLTINGIKVGDKAYCGLFKSLSPSAVIQNITFNNLSLVNVSVGILPLYVGAIEAYYPDQSNTTLSLSNIIVEIDSFDDGEAEGDVYFGGLLGCFEQDAPISISNCQVTTNNFIIHGKNIWWGGFVGLTKNKPISITNSSWTGVGSTTIIATTTVRAGGLIGNKTLNTFNTSNCRVSGGMDVTCAYYYIGSLIGYYNAITQATITDFSSSGFSVSVNGTPISVNNIGNQNKIQL